MLLRTIVVTAEKYIVQIEVLMVLLLTYRVVNRYEMPVIGYGSRSCDAEPVIRRQPA